MTAAPSWLKVAVAAAAIIALLNGVDSRLSRPRPIDTEPGAAPAQPGDHRVVVLNPFTTTAQAVRRLHAAGLSVACLVHATVWEPTRPDAGRYPPDVIGAPVRPGGTIRWLDLRRWEAVREILTDRFALCVAKGFDAVTFGQPDSSTQSTGFPLSQADQVAYEHQLIVAARAHDLTVRLDAGGAGVGTEGRRTTIGS